MQKLLAYIIICTGLLIGGLISLFFKYRKAKKLNRGVFDLKEKGKKVVVKFQDCEIKTREYFDTEQNDSIPTEIEMADALFGSNRPSKEVKKVVSVSG